TTTWLRFFPAERGWCVCPNTGRSGQPGRRGKALPAAQGHHQIDAVRPVGCCGRPPRPDETGPAAEQLGRERPPGRARGPETTGSRDGGHGAPVASPSGRTRKRPAVRHETFFAAPKLTC